MKRILITIASTALAISSVAQAAPNVIFILADDMGIGGLSSYQSEGAPSYMDTPNIDSLATNGIRFTQGLSCYPTCKPSRCSMLTGQYGVRTGNYRVSNLKTTTNPPEESHSPLILPISRDVEPGDKNNPAAPRKQNLATVFKAAGYRTAMYGKWHLANEKQKNLTDYWGYDVFHVSSSVHYADHFRNGNKILKITPALPIWSLANGDPYIINSGNPDDAKTSTYLAADVAGSFLETHSIEEHYTNMAMDFIDDTLANHPGTPFYLYLPYYLVHHPASADSAFTVAALARIQAYDAANGTSLATEDGGEYVDVVAMHSMLDEFVGRIIAHLDDPNGDGNTSDSITNNTIILFTSDNGSYNDHLTGPHRGKKGDTYDGGMRVPYIFKYPGQITGNTSSSERIMGIDIYPTLLGLAGLTPPANYPIDGVNLAPHITTSTPIAAREVFCFYPKYVWSDNQGRYAATWRNVIYDGDFKLIEYPEWADSNPAPPNSEIPYELFDISTDLHEDTNLATSNAPKKIELLRKLHTWLEDNNTIRVTEAQCLIDTYVQEDDVNTNADEPYFLTLNGSPGGQNIAYLKFNITKYPTSANHVRLNLTSDTLSGNIQVYSVTPNNEDWDTRGSEAKKWSNPLVLGPMIAELNNVTAGSTFEIPLGNAITTTGFFTVALKTTNLTDQVIRSRHAIEANERPSLIIDRDTDGDGIANDWEYFYFGENSIMTATSDSDSDGKTDLHEYNAGTNPTDNQDAFEITSSGEANATDWQLQWPSKPGKTYTIQETPDLQTWTDLPGVTITTNGSTSTAIFVKSTDPRAFYRIKVNP